MAKLIVGQNDLQTTHPEIATQAHGWDPTTVTFGVNKRVEWICDNGHKAFTWTATPNDRTRGKGCPACAGKQIIIGFNDLKATHPEIAAQAHGWDPTTVTAGSNKKMEWKCGSGHPDFTWKATPNDRSRGRGCPVCAGKSILIGFNDLKSTHPDIAAQAHGWDPTTVTSGSDKKLSWICELNHPTFVWQSKVNNRANGKGCPLCAGQAVLKGFNDLATTHPNIADQAHGWDPTSVSAGSTRKKFKWLCKSGHPPYVWETSVAKRTTSINEGCPVCNEKRLLVGYNDLATKCPDIASDAYDWDPKTVTAATTTIKEWTCEKGHTWKASVANRTRLGSGCPECAEHGYKKSLNGYLYLMRRYGEQQIGITNVPKRRLETHGTQGWQLIELSGPFSGEPRLESRAGTQAVAEGLHRHRRGNHRELEDIGSSSQQLG